MKILAIDTSTEACSAALYDSGTINTRFEIAPQKHSQLILPMCDELLADAQLTNTQLDAIAFGRGPGSFTGLRIAAGVTQGIAFAADLPVIGISTLAALAQKVCDLHPGSHIISAIDARMQEIYWAEFRSTSAGGIESIGEENISKPDQLQCSQQDDLVIVGSGWKEYGELIENNLGSNQICNEYPDFLPSAREIAKLAAIKFSQGEVVTPDQAIPVYLRNNVAKKSSQQTQV